MKKIFVIISAVLLAAASYAANDAVINAIKSTNATYKNIICDFDQAKNMKIVKNMKNMMKVIGVTMKKMKIMMNMILIMMMKILKKMKKMKNHLIKIKINNIYLNNFIIKF